MKLQIRIVVAGDIVLPPDVTALMAEWDYVSLSVRPHKNDGALEVSATRNVPVERAAECISRINRVGAKPDEVFVRYPVDIADELLNYLQKFESHLTFISPRTEINRLNWKSYTVAFVPESKAEEEMIAVNHISVDRTRPSQRLTLTPRLLDKIATRIRFSGDIYLSLAFFREGNADFRASRFAQAFCSDYFVIEDLYGGERTYRENEVLAAFKGQKHAMRAFGAALASFGKPEMKDHWAAILRHVKDTNCQVDALGLGRMMFRMRGRLRHFSRKRLATAGTPFNDANFESLALLGFYVGHLALMYHFIPEDRERAGLPPLELE